MKFKTGDHVRVINQKSKYFDRVGKVEVDDRVNPPCGVSGLDDGVVIWFGPDDLILAEDPEQASADDAVNHPQHYGGENDPYEVIKVAEAWGFDKDAYLFNVLKYIARAGKKGATLQDHKKARFYLDRKIGRMEAAE
ncbi:hypothetical protein SEA_ABBYDAISY_86 [Arthrobacter phage AbbyDaisy]|nr:hypothetical protein SEA_ABBYDAISY_86 [Arthrobacter phage AbbyDaisy]